MLKVTIQCDGCSNSQSVYENSSALGLNYLVDTKSKDKWIVLDKKVSYVTEIFEAKTYHFCSEICLEKFMEETKKRKEQEMLKMAGLDK